MTSFQKALKLAKKTDKHLFLHGSFHKKDKSIKDFDELIREKSAEIYRRTINTPGGWGTQRGRIC